MDNDFDEPARSEFCVASVKEMQQNVKGQEIVDGTDRSDEQHEISDQMHVPGSGNRHVFFVHIVGWDRELRGIIEKIIQKDLCWQHGQERQEHRCCRHAEHISGIGTGAHQ